MNWPKTTSVLKSPEYNTMVLDAIRAGNFEAKWAKVKSFANGHEGEFRIFGDALKIEGVRINVSAYLEQQIADILSCSLLTPKLADLRWYQRTATLPMFYAGDNVINGGTMDTSFEMIRHSERVDAALKDALGRGETDTLICTVGKDWVLDSILAQQPSKAVNYGWIATNGNHACVTPVALPAPNPHTSATPCRLFQQPGTAHPASHSDYSQVCVLVSRECIVDGVVKDIFKVMTDADLAPLVSHQGKLLVTRQPGVPEIAPLYAPEVRGGSSPSAFRRVSTESVPGPGGVEESRGTDWAAVAWSGGAIAATVGLFAWGLRAMGRAKRGGGVKENPLVDAGTAKVGDVLLLKGMASTQVEAILDVLVRRGLTLIYKGPGDRGVVVTDKVDTVVVGEPLPTDWRKYGLTRDITIRGRMPTPQEYKLHMQLLTDAAYDERMHGRGVNKIFQRWLGKDMDDLQHAVWFAVHDQGLMKQDASGRHRLTRYGQVYLAQRQG